MTQVIVAAGSQVAAQAGAEIANQGGNAVDAAIAAAIVAMCTDIGVMAPGAGGFIAIGPPKGDVVVIDAYAEVPGRGLPPEHLQVPSTITSFTYGSLMSTGIGYGSIATPGFFAGLEQAAQAGKLGWTTLLAPAIRLTAQGFPLSGGAAEYLSYTHAAVFSWHPDSYRTVHDAQGNCLKAGTTVQLPELSASLQQMASEGTAALYGGSLGQTIADEIQANEGLLTLADLQAYRAIPRVPLQVDLADWTIATNPFPAVGGVCLAALLLLCDRNPIAAWTPETVRRWVTIQEMVLGYRQHHGLGDLQFVENLLKLAQQHHLCEAMRSPSTIHISAVDDQGVACSISASAGYGSGAMITGTGMWFNNALGELELYAPGRSTLQPGTRLISNMAPTIARHADGAVLAIGSPGASRITTAIAQVLLNYIQVGLSLSEAVTHPRLHVEVAGQLSVSYEAGVRVEDLDDWLLNPFPQRSMYFGGVQAALWQPGQGLTAVADARRGGFVAQGGR